MRTVGEVLFWGVFLGAAVAALVLNVLRVFETL